MSMISGVMAPDSGRITREGELSWPLGFSGGMHPALSGTQNVRFVARIYGKDTKDLLQYVNEFAELGSYMDMPVRSYSSGMRARLAFGLSLGVSFDYYLIDEVTAVGDKGFVDKAREALSRRLESAGVIMVSHSVPNLRQFCTSGVVLHEGTLEYYEDIEDAIEVHTSRYSSGN
ncbi:MAG: ABC transporter ATP-binding protein, partial [Pikeienuella sp.]